MDQGKTESRVVEVEGEKKETHMANVLERQPVGKEKRRDEVQQVNEKESHSVDEKEPVDEKKEPQEADAKEEPRAVDANEGLKAETAWT